jgi:hypothetical protein
MSLSDIPQIKKWIEQIRLVVTGQQPASAIQNPFEITPTPPIPPGKPVEGNPKQGGNQDPAVWHIVPMVDNPALFKIVDNMGKNIATDFTSSPNAQAYIDYYKGQVVVTPPGPPPTTPPGPLGELDQFGVKKIYPDKAGGKVETKFTNSGVGTRHYRSGKPDDSTIEYTNQAAGGAGIKFQECTGYLTMHGMNHPDSIDWKVRGGHHGGSSAPEDMQGRCYDFEVMTDGSNKKVLEKEWPHPSMHKANVTTLFNIGKDISSATFGYKAISFPTPDNKGVHMECWLDLDGLDSTGKPINNWKKYWEASDTGQISNAPLVDPIGNYSFIRIDGIKGAPDFRFFSVREIEVAGTPAAAAATLLEANSNEDE